MTEWAVTVNLSERSHRQHPSFFTFLPFSRGFLGGGGGGVTFLGIREGLRGGTAGRPGMAGMSSSSGSKQTCDVSQSSGRTEQGTERQTHSVFESGMRLQLHTNEGRI